MSNRTLSPPSPPGPQQAPAPDAAVPFTRASRRARLSGLLAERILVLDGAMGTMLQAYEFDEAGYRGDRFRDHPRDLRGDNDLLTLTQPDAVRAVHAGYLDAGADIISTNSFTATRIAQADYGLDDEVVRDLNATAARLARAAADAAEARDPGRPRFVAGALGPTNRTASISPDVGDPAARAVTWLELQEAYHDAAAALVEGGADILLIETIFDTLNAKAAIFARRDPVRRARRAAAGHRVRDHRRRVRSDALGADGRGVLAQHPPRRPAGRRAQLRPRAEAAARAPRRAGAHRRPARVGLSERRPPERAGWL